MAVTVNIMILDYYVKGESWSYSELGPREFEAIPPVGSYVTLERDQWIRTFKVNQLALHSPPSEQRGFNVTAYIEYVDVRVGGDHSLMNEEARTSASVRTHSSLGENDWKELREITEAD